MVINFHLLDDPKIYPKKLYEEYLQGKQTYKQLAIKYNRSIPWIQKQLDAYAPDCRLVEPRAVTVSADATFFGKRRDRLGLDVLDLGDYRWQTY